MGEVGESELLHCPVVQADIGEGRELCCYVG